MLSEFQMFRSAERFLLAFGGLKVDQSGSGETSAREPFDVDPTLAAYEGNRFNEFSLLVSTNLYPLGEAVSGNYYWTIGEDSQLFILMDDIKLLGKNTEEALENLILGPLPHENSDVIKR